MATLSNPTYDDTLVLKNMIKHKLWKNSKEPMTSNFYNDKKVQFVGIESCKSYNVGILGGKVNNIIVVDLDTHKWDLQTHPWILTFGRALKKFDTYTVKTCSGGYHLYFLYDDDLADKKNSSIGIDVLSNGTYIVAPHSHIYNIKKNIIHKDYTVYHDTSIKPIPEDLKQFLFEHIYTSNSQKMKRPESMKLNLKRNLNMKETCITT